MTTEQKAKAYDEALKKAKMYHQNAKEAGEYSAVARYENIFPELTKSDDERIRKEILAEFKVERDTISDCITTEYDDTDDADKLRLEWLNDAIAYLEKQKEQKSAEWSEEDEKFFITALWHISYSVSNGRSTDCRCDTTEWLKSIKERIRTICCPAWKPSEEQMEALGKVPRAPELYDLYNDLKKLM